MGLHHHQPFITAPQRGDGARYGIYHHATTWSVPMPQHGIARRSYLFLAPLGGKLDVAGVVFQNLLAQGCRVDMRVNLCG